MTRPDAGKLLGGHATGTLTEAERRALCEAALEDQALFDALVDEEALRELLADPEARAQVLAALAPAAPKVRPLWRRPGVLASAASLLMASLAGLTWLRNPKAPPALPEAPAVRQETPPVRPETRPAPAVAPASEGLAGAQPQVPPTRNKPRSRPSTVEAPAPSAAAPLPAPPPAALAMPALKALASEAAAPAAPRLEAGKAEAQDGPARKALRAPGGGKETEGLPGSGLLETAPRPRILALSAAAETSDPAALRRELSARLEAPAERAALADLPPGTRLTLEVDATGRVVAARFDRAFPQSARAEALVRAWRLSGWAGGRSGPLELILALRP